MGQQLVFVSIVGVSRSWPLSKQQDRGPLRSIRTKRFAFSALEAEPNTWLVLCMRHPQLDAKSGAGSSAGADGPEVRFDEDCLFACVFARGLGCLCARS